MTNPPKHSPLSASSMHRWSNCPGSVALSVGQPNLSSPAAQEGTNAHEAATKWLWDKVPTNDPFVGIYVKLIQDEVINLANYYAFEEPFAYPEFHPDFRGTADCIAYYLDRKLLRVYDLKYGKKKVDALNNLQLLYYAFGAFIDLGKNFPIERVEVIISQPRYEYSSRVRRWSFGLEELWDFGLKFKEAARATEDKNAPLNLGEWCFFCPARMICPAQESKKVAKAQEEFGEYAGT